jgi:hypothetical protein
LFFVESGASDTLNAAHPEREQLPAVLLASEQ